MRGDSVFNALLKPCRVVAVQKCADPIFIKMMSLDVLDVDKFACKVIEYNGN